MWKIYKMRFLFFTSDAAIIIIGYVFDFDVHWELAEFLADWYKTCWIARKSKNYVAKSSKKPELKNLNKKRIRHSIGAG